MVVPNVYITASLIRMYVTHVFHHLSTSWACWDGHIFIENFIIIYTTKIALSACPLLIRKGAIQCAYTL